MEIFYECFLTGDFNRKKSTMKIIQITLIIIAAITYVLLGPTVVIFIALLYIITIVISNYIFVEYEYSLTNNELDIAKIVDKSRRKTICTIDIAQVSGVTKLEDYKGQAKYKKCYVGNNQIKTLIITTASNGQKNSFALKINEELLVLLKRINPSVFNRI